MVEHTSNPALARQARDGGEASLVCIVEYQPRWHYNSVSKLKQNTHRRSEASSKSASAGAGMGLFGTERQSLSQTPTRKKSAKVTFSITELASAWWIAQAIKGSRSAEMIPETIPEPLLRTSALLPLLSSICLPSCLPSKVNVSTYLDDSETAQRENPCRRVLAPSTVHPTTSVFSTTLFLTARKAGQHCFCFLHAFATDYHNVIHFSRWSLIGCSIILLLNKDVCVCVCACVKTF